MQVLPTDDRFTLAATPITSGSDRDTGITSRKAQLAECGNATQYGGETSYEQLDYESANYFQADHQHHSETSDSDYQRQLLRLLNTLHRENTQLRAQLRIDPLTGLFNRRALFDELEREWEHWLRYCHTASLILIDVNQFKAINDSYGHQTGDDVLIGIAKQLEQQVRASDWVARLGGDEFAILLRDTDAVDAEKFAEKLRDMQFIVARKNSGLDTPLFLRCSAGVATLAAGIKSIREWLEAADQQMYRHKRSVYLRPSNTASQRADDIIDERSNERRRSSR